MTVVVFRDREWAIAAHLLVIVATVKARLVGVDADIVIPLDVKFAIVAVAQRTITTNKFFASTWNLQQSWAFTQGTFADVF